MSEQVRICYMGSFINMAEAEDFEEEFMSFWKGDIDAGNLVIIEQSISTINTKFVVRIMAENAQQELSLQEWHDENYEPVVLEPVVPKSKLILPPVQKLIGFE